VGWDCAWAELFDTEGRGNLACPKLLEELLVKTSGCFFVFQQLGAIVIFSAGLAHN
jgi:hypothetical protein